MSFQRYQIVAFGASQSGRTSVSYRLYDSAGAAAGSVVTAGVEDLGGGEYGALVTFPDGFAGRITWDAGAPDHLTASAAVEPEEATSEQALAIERALGDLQVELDEIDVAIDRHVPPGPGGLAAGAGPTVTAGLPDFEGCQILGRVKAFAVSQGVRARIAHTVRDPSGRAADLSDYETPAESASASASASSGSAAGWAVLRAREPFSPAGCPSAEDFAQVTDGPGGVVEAVLPASVVAVAGVYTLSFGFFDSAGRLARQDDALLIVEKSLFGPATVDPRAGPPRLSELRQELLDSDRRENLRTDSVEFGVEQLAQALIDPVRQWNETPPQISPFSTRTFPYALAWKDAAVGHLLRSAANWYRRNRQQAQGGGLLRDDLDREDVYLRAAQGYLDRFAQFVRSKKTELNYNLMWGAVGSDYGRL